MELLFFDIFYLGMNFHNVFINKRDKAIWLVVKIKSVVCKIDYMLPISRNVA